MIASAIANIPHMAGLVNVAGSRFDAVPLQDMLIFIIDTVPAEALPYIAAQFNVLGIKGWLLANTEQKKRDLIKRAIELHRRKGTPWAIKNALASVGYPTVVIVEGVGLNYDGSFDYDGSQNYGGGYWANFLVRIYTDETPSAGDQALIISLINEYKNERSNLVDVEYYITA